MRELRKGGLKVDSLFGKQVIVLGDRDGVPGPAIEACVQAAGGTVVHLATQCYV
jgi:glycine reductase